MDAEHGVGEAEPRVVWGGFQVYGKEVNFMVVLMDLCPWENLSQLELRTAIALRCGFLALLILVCGRLGCFETGCVNLHCGMNILKRCPCRYSLPASKCLITSNLEARRSRTFYLERMCFVRVPETR